MLATVMRIQSVVFLIYGLAFFLLPDFTLDTIFGYETSSVFPRSLGAVFLAVAMLEWKLVKGGDERNYSLPFVEIPALILVALLWEKFADTYDGSDLFLWVSVAVAASFTVAVGAARMQKE